MIYKAVMSMGPHIVLDSEETVKNVIDNMIEGKKIVATKFGIINTSFLVSIVKAKELNEEVGRLMQLANYKKSEAINEVLGVSPFARMIEDKITPQLRTAAQEESSRKGRQK